MASEKVRENEKEREELKASRPKKKTLLMKKILVTVFTAYILPKTIQITNIKKSVNYYMDKMGRNQKEEQKSKGAGKVNNGKGKTISQC